jgi:hypothetical protein
MLKFLIWYLADFSEISGTKWRFKLTTDHTDYTDENSKSGLRFTLQMAFRVTTIIGILMRLQGRIHFSKRQIGRVRCPQRTGNVDGLIANPAAR